MFILLLCAFIAYILDINDLIKVLIVIVGVILIIMGIVFATRIEQVAKYSECKKFGHKYIPTYNQILFSMHYGRTRYVNRTPMPKGRDLQQSRILGIGASLKVVD